MIATPVDRVEGPAGRGAAQVWVVVPTGPIRSVVVFGHGWKVAPPSPSYPWVGQFRPWLDHLAANGSAVVFPRYQLGGDRPGAATAAAFRRGVALGLARLRVHVPVVAAGYSYGASLALAYAANARRWGLPAPAAVDAVFPAAPVAGPEPPLPSSTRVLLQVGDRDVVAGRSGADTFWRLLRGHAAKRYEVVRSRGGLVATHAAPKESTAAARRAFWTPLDALVAAARRRP